MAQNRINKLELTWIGKENDPIALEPRLLIDTPEYSYGDVEIGTLPNGKPWPGNMLIMATIYLHSVRLKKILREQ